MKSKIDYSKEDNKPNFDPRLRAVNSTTKQNKKLELQDLEGQIRNLLAGKLHVVLITLTHNKQQTLTSSTSPALPRVFSA